MLDRCVRVSLCVVSAAMLGLLATAGDTSRSGRPKWTPETARRLRDWLGLERVSPAQEQSLASVLADFHQDRQAEAIVTESLAGKSMAQGARLSLLRVLADPRIDPLPDAWEAALGRALDSGNRDTRREAVATLKVRDLGRFDRRLLEIGLQANLPVELRLAALDCVAGRQKRLPTEAFALLAGHLSDPTGPVDRVTAARALGAGRLDREQLLQLAKTLTKVEPTEGMLLLSAFTRSRDTDVGLALVKALEDSPALRLMNASDLNRVLTPYPDKVLAAAKPLGERLGSRLKERRQDLSRLRVGLLPGDADRGRAVFFSEKANCSLCHRAAGKGGSVGTNLSKIGFIRGPAELLESILLPSASIVPEFRPYSVSTTRGRSATGLWVGETAGSVFLRSGEAAAVTSIPREEVETLELSRLSLMPEGFEKLLSLQELSDVIEFLVQQR